MRPGDYHETDLTNESRILGSHGRERDVTIVPVGVFPSPPAVFRHPQSVMMPLADPELFLVLEWTTGKRADAEPEAMKVQWRRPAHGDT